LNKGKDNDQISTNKVSGKKYSCVGLKLPFRLQLINIIQKIYGISIHVNINKLL